MLVVNGHAKHRRSLCRVGYGKAALSMNLKILQNKRFLTSVRNDKYAIIFALSTLTPPSNRNPQGVTLPRYLRLIAAGAVEASLSTFIFHLCSVLCTLFSVLCLYLSFLPKIEKCTYLFGCSFRSSRSAVAAEHVLLRLL